MDAPVLEKLQKALTYQFKNASLLELALTHTSFTNESKGDLISNNQRMEFLGDSVLSLVLTEHLYNSFAQEREGVLAKYKAALVKGDYLAEIALKLKLNEFILLGEHERRTGGELKKSILEDCLEALIAAIYLDSDYKTTQAFILNTLYPDLLNNLPDIVEEENPKGHLQEFLSKISPTLAPQYDTIKHKGPDHDRIFFVEVSVDDTFLAKGDGRSLKKAQEEAARKALELLGENPNLLSQD